jgi:Caulimovirus viroplasmin
MFPHYYRIAATATSTASALFTIYSLRVGGGPGSSSAAATAILWLAPFPSGRYFSATTSSTTTMPPTKKFYAVAVGRNIGIYDTWDDCQKEVRVHSKMIKRTFEFPSHFDVCVMMIA